MVQEMSADLTNPPPEQSEDKGESALPQIGPLPRASVIVPTFNSDSTIPECLRALLRQESAAIYEVIVADDGSSDATVLTASQFAGVRILRGTHSGPATARNSGARAARGEILLFTDSDCAPAENWLRAMLVPFSDDPTRTVGVKGVYRTRQTELMARFVQLEYEEKYLRMSRARSIDFVDTYSAAYKRDAFLANGGFDESFPSASVEDQEFSFRLAEKGMKMVFASDAIVYHRHVTTMLAYARRKFRIGYWKVRVHRRHPGKAWEDAHTPPTLKAQVGLIFAVALASFAAVFYPYFWYLVLCLAFAFVLSAMPLLLLIARRDRTVALFAPLFIAVRAAALALGLAAGVLGEVARSQLLKRAVDLVGATVGLVLFAPVMLVIAIAVKLDSPGPILFRQARAGQGGKPFSIIKFRSMVEGAEGLLDQVIAQSCLPPPVFKIPNDPRVTRVGRFLRRFSLDELPQFVNVLKGEMSLVGPRPEELRIVALYGERALQRVAAKPGMTGPMQTDGRGALDLDTRLSLELAYIEQSSIWEDLRLLIRTVPAVIRGRGAF